MNHLERQEAQVRIVIAAVSYVEEKPRGLNRVVRTLVRWLRRGTRHDELRCDLANAVNTYLELERADRRGS